MSTQVLKDSRYNVIGYVETRSDGTQVVKDARHSVRGYYDPKTNTTKDVQFRVVGQGNLLSSLLR
jgi:hypothetical protein